MVGVAPKDYTATFAAMSWISAETINWTNLTGLNHSLTKIHKHEVQV